MNLRLWLLLGLSICLLVELEAGKDKRRRKPNNRKDDTEDEESGAGRETGFGDRDKKDREDRVGTLVERQNERAKERKENAEESSEEKDEEENGKNATSNPMKVVLPKRRMRRDHHTVHETKKSQEINDGKQLKIDKKPSQQTSRLRRDHHGDHGVHETKPSREINDGKQLAINNKPSHQTSHRHRRHHGDILEHRGGGGGQEEVVEVNQLHMLRREKELNDDEILPLLNHQRRRNPRNSEVLHETVRSKEINGGREIPLNANSQAGNVGESYIHRRGRKHGKLHPKHDDEVTESSEEIVGNRQRRSLRHKITLTKAEAQGLQLVNKEEALNGRYRHRNPRA